MLHEDELSKATPRTKKALMMVAEAGGSQGKRERGSTRKEAGFYSSRGPSSERQERGGMVRVTWERGNGDLVNRWKRIMGRRCELKSRKQNSLEAFISELMYLHKH